MQPLTDYYFLSVSLPELKLGLQPELTWAEVKVLLESNLRKGHMRQVEAVLRIFDLYNMRATMQKLPIGFEGNWDQKQLQTKLLDLEDLPPYLEQYMEKWEEDEDRVGHFPDLLESYYGEEAKEGGRFLRKYLLFEEKLRWILMLLRAKKMGREVEPKENEWVQELLDEEEWELPEPFEGVTAIFEKHARTPLEIEKELDAFRFHWVEEQIDFDFFSFRHVLGYVLQFLMADKLWRYQSEKQEELVHAIVKDISDE